VPTSSSRRSDVTSRTGSGGCRTLEPLAPGMVLDKASLARSGCRSQAGAVVRGRGMRHRAVVQLASRASMSWARSGSAGAGMVCSNDVACGVACSGVSMLMNSVRSLSRRLAACAARNAARSWAFCSVARFACVNRLCRQALGSVLAGPTHQSPIGHRVGFEPVMGSRDCPWPIVFSG
jgi:hypothetical protein